MKKQVLITLLISVFGLYTINIQAQKKTTTNDLKGSEKVHIETIDGNDYFGKLISKDSASVKIETESLGEVSIKKATIKSISIVNSKDISIDGEIWLPNHHATRYLFAPSAFGLKKGEGYYQNSWVFYNQVQYGVSDRFSIGGGLIPTFIFGGGVSTPVPFWITPKVSIPTKRENVNFSVGSLSVFSGVNKSLYAVGILYGQSTFGNKNKNLSVGLGWGYAAGDGESAMARRPTLNVSGMVRVSKRGYIVTENWFASVGGGSIDRTNFSLLSCAYRFAPKSVAIDLGVFVSPTIIRETETFFGLPWLSVAIPFGKSNI